MVKMQTKLIARRATPSGYLKQILLTPVIVPVLLLLLRGPLVFFLALFGITQEIPLGPEMIVVIAGMLVCLALLAVVLSVYDHFLYRGWTTNEQVSLAEFVTDVEIALQTADCSLGRDLMNVDSRSAAPAPEQFAEWAKRFSSCYLFSRPNFHRTELQLLAANARGLNRIKDSRTTAIALYFLNEPVQSGAASAVRAMCICVGDINSEFFLQRVEWIDAQLG